jgi:Asp-tRNA(Asn)/Glu-tRNA(Gln) amidotransferase A subunit family amidase
MTDLSGLTATEAIAALASGAMTATEYAEALLARTKAIDGDIKAFIHLDPEHVLMQARMRDEWRLSGRPLGALHGVPVGIKDIFDTEDYPTENGWGVHAGRRPSRDAEVVRRLREAGAIIFGKTVTTEVAYFNPGATRNPHDTSRTPGGSSSGSAAAVAAGMVPLALGSQTNGSVIRPAAFCGVVGLKPSHGTISRSGVLLLSKKLDHVGIFARSVGDAALLLDVLAGYDPGDSDTRMLASRGYAATAAEKPPLPPKLAFVRTPKWERADPATRKSFEALAEKLGDHVEVVDLPQHFDAAWDQHRVIMASDMAHRFGPLVDQGGDKSSEQLHKLMEQGRDFTSVAYLDANANVRHMRASLAGMFERYYAILTPAAPGPAPKGTATGDPVFNSLWTMTGQPAVTLPLLSGEDDMPVGVQLVGAFGDDARLLRTANWLTETVAPKKRKRSR